MCKMVTTQRIQKIKILFLCSTKKVFNLKLEKFLVFAILFLFSCSSNLIKAQDIKPEDFKCGSNSSIDFFKKNGVFTEYDKWHTRTVWYVLRILIWNSRITIYSRMKESTTNILLQFVVFISCTDSIMNDWLWVFAKYYVLL